MSATPTADVVIVGASASGLMCAAEAARRGRRVVLLEQARQAGRKILMSGGGRCNFTNYTVEPENYLSANPHFCKSALSRYTQWDFIALVEKHRIRYEEREHGQLFCSDSARDILDMLLTEARSAGAELRLRTAVERIERDGGGYLLHTDKGEWRCSSLVIATGGLSIPSMGAGPFGYRVAEQFGIAVQPTRPGLVPFTLQQHDKARLAPLAGIAVEAQVSCAKASFREQLLFTHRGLSGPVVLQISSYWRPGETITIDLLPGRDVFELLKQAQYSHPKRSLRSQCSAWLPQRLIDTLLGDTDARRPLADLSHVRLQRVADTLNAWTLKPNATEGWRTAEVTCGGVDTHALSSKTLEAREVPGLYFIGEVVDVTGWLGGYNFQWAWSSGWCAGQVV